MKVTEVENKGLKRAYDVVVTADAIEKQIEKELKRVSRNVKIPGFRPGKVPAAVLKQRYGKSVLGDVIQRTANEASENIIKNNKLVPALAPDVKITDYQEGGDLALSIALEIMPDVPAIDYKKITIERPSFDVGDKEIDEALELLAKRNRQMTGKAKDAKAEAGDVVVIDFKGFIGDEAFPGGEAKGYSLELGSGQFIPGFEDQLIGKKAGDSLDVNVPFPKDYHKADLAGKKAKFEVTVHAIQTPKEPKVDESFAKSIGMENLKSLRDAIKQQLENDYGALVRNKLKKSLFDELEGKCSFEVPEGMLSMEFDAIWQQYEDAKKRGGVDDEGKSEKELEKEYKDIASRRVRLGILLSNTAREQKIEVAQQELLSAVQQQASMYPGQEQKVFDFYKENPQQVHELRGPILEEKAVDYILTQVTIKDKKVDVESLLSDDDEAAAKPKKKPAAKKATSEKKESATKKPASKKPAAKKTAAKK